MWEYCEIRLVKGTLGGVFIKYFIPNGPPLEFKTDPNFILSKHESGVERAIAQLGQLNWEIIAKPSSEPYLFKRTKTSGQSFPTLKGFIKIES
ncbi:MAG: hypothetical protein COB02_07625 [Candidatus Cloacimonadota bacterium]|nr:MAG: hypothetical protein COB02_07625 [Candidatus Cloacimonadota bacterium]